MEKNFFAGFRKYSGDPNARKKEGLPGFVCVGSPPGTPGGTGTRVGLDLPSGGQSVESRGGKRKKNKPRRRGDAEKKRMKSPLPRPSGRQAEPSPVGTLRRPGVEVPLLFFFPALSASPRFIFFLRRSSAPRVLLHPGNPGPGGPGPSCGRNPLESERGKREEKNRGDAEKKDRERHPKTQVVAGWERFRWEGRIGRWSRFFFSLSSPRLRVSAV